MSDTDTESPGLGRYFSYPSAESGKDETYDLLLCLSGILDLNGYEYSKDGDALTLENGSHHSTAARRAPRWKTS